MIRVIEIQVIEIWAIEIEARNNYGSASPLS